MSDVAYAQVHKRWTSHTQEGNLRCDCMHGVDIRGLDPRSPGGGAPDHFRRRTARDLHPARWPAGGLLGVALGVKANVGGVGIAMMFLIAGRLRLMRHGQLGHGLKIASSPGAASTSRSWSAGPFPVGERGRCGQGGGTGCCGIPGTARSAARSGDGGLDRVDRDGRVETMDEIEAPEAIEGERARASRPGVIRMKMTSDVAAATRLDHLLSRLWVP